MTLYASKSFVFRTRLPLAASTNRKLAKTVIPSTLKRITLTGPAVCTPPTGVAPFGGAAAKRSSMPQAASSTSIKRVTTLRNKSRMANYFILLTKRRKCAFVASSKVMRLRTAFGIPTTRLLSGRRSKRMKSDFSTQLVSRSYKWTHLWLLPSS